MKQELLLKLLEGLKFISESRKNRKHKNKRSKKHNKKNGMYGTGAYGTYFYPGFPMARPRMMAPILPGGPGPMGGPGGPMGPGPGGFDGGPGGCDCGGFGEADEPHCHKKDKELDEQMLITLTKQIRKKFRKK